MKNTKDLRIVFIGRKNAFNEGIMHWLQTRFTLLGIFIVEQNTLSIKNILKTLRSRCKKIGYLHTLNEVLFKIIYALFFRKRDVQLFNESLSEFFHHSKIDSPFFFCDNIHDNVWSEKIKQYNPDIIFSVCANTIFKPSLFNIPKFGTFVLHEGITPEYKGKDTALWAILKKEYNYFGYTLIKVTEEIDGGPIVCQGVFPDAVKFDYNHITAGHLALIYGLDNIHSSLEKLYLNNGNFENIPIDGRSSHTYRYVTFSDFLKYYTKMPY